MLTVCPPGVRVPKSMRPAVLEYYRKHADRKVESEPPVSGTTVPDTSTGAVRISMANQSAVERGPRQGGVPVAGEIGGEMGAEKEESAEATLGGATENAVEHTMTASEDVDISGSKVEIDPPGYQSARAFVRGDIRTNDRFPMPTAIELRRVNSTKVSKMLRSSSNNLCAGGRRNNTITAYFKPLGTGERVGGGRGSGTDTKKSVEREGTHGSM